MTAGSGDNGRNERLGESRMRDFSMLRALVNFNFLGAFHLGLYQGRRKVYTVRCRTRKEHGLAAEQIALTMANMLFSLMYHNPK